MSARRTLGKTLTAGLALALCLALAACAEDPQSGSPQPSGSAESSDSASSEPASPSPSEPSSPEPTESTPDVSAAKGNARLLTATQMPGFNQTFRWRVGQTRPQEGAKPFGTCHRFAMTSIGATQVTVRTYEPTMRSPGVTASHLLADFPDDRTAKRAYEVLRSWGAQCRESLRRYDRVQVGGLQQVSLPSRQNGDDSTAGWYLLIYGPVPGDPDAGFFDAQGISRVGSTVAVVQMRLIGQDYNYPPGQEPMVAAIQTAAAKLAP